MHEEEFRRDFRRQVARQDIPLVLVWAGGIMLALAATNAARTGLAGGSLWLNVPLGLALIGIAAVLRRPSFPSTLVQPVFTCAVVLLTISLTYQAWANSWLIDLAYALVVITAFGPVVLDRVSFLIGGSIMVVTFGIGAHALIGAEWVSWATAGLAAALASAGLLHVRIRAVFAQADAHQEVEQLAVTDRLTGLLNRHGFDLLLPQVVSTASRYEQGIYACFIDVDGLKAANDRHGHDFGDGVLQCVAHAVRVSIREGDVAARWGGDEFLVLGIGEAPAADRLTAALNRQIASSGLDATRWSGTVSLGLASGRPSRESAADVIARADQDMYQRRSIRRSTS